MKISNIESYYGRFITIKKIRLYFTRKILPDEWDIIKINAIKGKGIFTFLGSVEEIDLNDVTFYKL